MKQTDEEAIQAAFSLLDENGKKLHAEAITQGHKDEICPLKTCRAVMLAHYHLVRCDPNVCPMVARADPNPDGTPKNMLDIIFGTTDPVDAPTK